MLDEELIFDIDAARAAATAAWQQVAAAETASETALEGLRSRLEALLEGPAGSRGVAAEARTAYQVEGGGGTFVTEYNLLPPGCVFSLWSWFSMCLTISRSCYSSLTPSGSAHPAAGHRP